MTNEEWQQVAKGLEPAALADTVGDARYTISIAVSLKRIADAMWGNNQNMGVIELLDAINRKQIG